MKIKHTLDTYIYNNKNAYVGLIEDIQFVVG
jgi:hypothetical protein